MESMVDWANNTYIWEYMAISCPIDFIVITNNDSPWTMFWLSYWRSLLTANCSTDKKILVAVGDETAIIGTREKSGK